MVKPASVILNELAGDSLCTIPKDNPDSQAWFATIGNVDVFVKCYPAQNVGKFSDAASAVAVETSIAGGCLHPAIVPLRQVIECADGTLMIYDRVSGENLGVSEVRRRFNHLPLTQRQNAVYTVGYALATLCEAGFTVVDWYYGNMLYDFDLHKTWLFDWELCRPGNGFTLETDENFGSSTLMAPEEFRRGNWLDERTLVYNVGRYALMTLPELAESDVSVIFARATYPARAERYATVRTFINALAATTGR